ncbi:MAG: asparagine synthase C-terminal domain-containing protein [Candidatus Woesearchaeota archaeon]
MRLPTTTTEWQNYIAHIRERSEIDTLKTHEEAVGMIGTLLEKTILEQADQALDQGAIGLLFSGGIDSTLIGFILKKNARPFTAVSIGFQDNPGQKLPEDILAARDTSEKLGFEYIEEICNFERIEELFKETASILGPELVNAVNIGVGSVEAEAIKQLKKENPGITHIFTGLGSEEIFAGYKRHADSENVHAECWNGLDKMFRRDLLRELALTRHFNVTALAPFLDEDVIEKAMTIPAKWKLSERGSKLILREAAKQLGLEVSFSQRPKKAAQYGSRTHHALTKLSRKHGHAYIKDYLATL